MKDTIKGYDPNKLYTQNEYAKLIGKTRQRVNQMVRDKELKTIEVKGTTLIIKE